MASTRIRTADKRTGSRRLARRLSRKAATDMHSAGSGATPPIARILLPDGAIDLAMPRGGDVSSTVLQHAAMQWSYIVRNRKRWADRAALADEQSRRARDLLEGLGLSGDQLVRLAHAHVAQVAIPYRDEQHGWELRILPWEFLLSAATRAGRSGQALTILRQLERPTSPPGPAWRPPRSVLYVESVPGPLAGRYSFESERALVRTHLANLTWHELLCPTAEQLQHEIETKRPDVIHLAGFDTYQGLRLAEHGLTETEGDSPVPVTGHTNRDGYCVAGVTQPMEVIEAERLAGIITAQGHHRPLLVGCSFWNSAARVAPLLVAAGVHAVVGFQDSFDDELVELFYAGLYRRWRHASWNLTDAFLEAWSLLRERPVGLLGTGVVLWSDAPYVGPSLRARHATSAASRQRLRASVDAEAKMLLDPKRVTRDQLDRHIRVELMPVAELNYSLLHNRRPLFERFKLVKLKPGRLMDVTVTVDMDGGPARLPYRKTFEITDEKLDLQSDIHASLTATLGRSLRESVSASLFVEVTWGDHVLHRNTHRVRLLPADQWRDTDQDRLWLPSFVLPRDTAVGDLIESALRYVRVLRDDPGAGFDGYQSIDQARDDPTEDVDLQVRAIWSAIVHEWRLGYVNPPPTYSKELDSQRLRTPSTIRAARSGTCIDLALLFAACLELVDIYPVIFLLEGHAFPGYWRSEQAHQDFLKVGQKGLDELSAQNDGPASVAGTQSEPWIFGPPSYEEILRYVEAGDLVPIETTQLTENAGFWDAVQTGAANLRDAVQANATPPFDEFQLMLDIVSARYAGVTPLPIVEAGQ